MSGSIDVSVANSPLAEPVKFALLKDLGDIIVPDDYDHTTYLASFKREREGEFWYYNRDIKNTNFPNPSRILKAGERLRARSYHQIIPGETSWTERMGFLRGKQAVFVGAQGAALVIEQKLLELPQGRWHASFDEEDHLWQDDQLRRRVPDVSVNSDYGFNFCLFILGCPRNQNYAFLGFFDEDPDA